MRQILALGLCLAAFATYAAEQPASEASIRQLIEITQTKSLVDGMVSQVVAMMQNSMRQAAGGATLTAEQQAIVDDMRKRIVALVSGAMKWERMEPDIIATYKKSFTEKEVTAMLQFYRTEAGQALITKMPAVMQDSLNLAQKRLSAIAPQMQQIQKDTVEKLKTCCKN